MAQLSFAEKQLIETVFGMSGGYVLDFSNREFEEFMKDVVSYYKQDFTLRIKLNGFSS